jgi:AcrR family transcriptional regulator
MSVATPRQARSERTLEKILAACDRLLAKRSFEQISMQDIASEAGVSVGNLYNRFSDKGGLIDHVLATHQARFMDKIREAAANEPDDLDTRGRLAAMVEQFSAGILSLRPLYMTMASRRARGDETDATIKVRSSGLIELYVDWLLVGDPALDVDRCRFALAMITSSLQFDLLFGTQQRMFGAEYKHRLVEQALAYLSLPSIDEQ